MALKAGSGHSGNRAEFLLCDFELQPRESRSHIVGVINWV
jgi:hypothetical protein